MPDLFIDRLDAKQEMLSKLKMRKGVCIYGMPGAGKTLFLTRTLKEKFGKQLFIFDILQFATSALDSSTLSNFILTGAGVQEGGTLPEFIASLSNREALVVLDHIDGLKLSTLATLEQKTLISVGETLTELKQVCQANGIYFVFCGRNDHSLTLEILGEECQAIYGNSPEYKEILHKIELYGNILSFSASDMQTMYLGGFSQKQIKDVCEKFLPSIGMAADEETIEALTKKIVEQIGLHPSMVITLLQTAIYQHLAGTSFDLDRRFEDACIGSYGTYKRIFDSIWKYSIRPLYREEVKKLSAHREFIPQNHELLYRRMLTDLQLSGVVLRDRDRYRFFSELFRQWIYDEKAYNHTASLPRETSPTFQEPSQVTVDKNRNTSTIITANVSTEITGQAAKFFIYLYEKAGTLVPRKELLQAVFDVNEESDHNLNKLYQVKKLVTDKLSNSSLCIDSTSGKGSRKGYTLNEKC